ncbi:hypothetical protein Tco_0800096, partial [Tanacetum coccineum]
IVGQILLDHPLSYAITMTVDVPAVYLQQFWKTVSEVPDTKDTIKFKLDTQEIIYVVDMFCDTFHLPMETPDNTFIAPVDIEIIQSFMQRVGYQGVVDKVSAFYMKCLAQPWQTMFKKKDVIQYPCFTKHVIADLMKKYPSISAKLEEDYHSIKDDILLVSVYTMGNVTVLGMLILDAFLTDEIRATGDYKEYEMVFVGVVVPMNQPQSVVSTQGTHRTTPRAYRTPTLNVASPQGKKRKQSAKETSSQSKSLKVTIKQKQVVEGGQDDESYASKFAASMLNDDDDDDSEKKDEKNDDEMGSLEIRTEKMQTPIPTPLSSPRKILSSDKKTFQELTNIVSNLTRKIEKSSTSNTSCRNDNFHSQHHDDHQDDDAPLEGEKRVKRQTTFKRSKSEKEWDAWVEETIISEDEVIPKDETSELIIKFQNFDKRVPTIFNHARMEATLNDMLSN